MSYWRKKDGSVVPVSKMSDEHLKNAAQMLERNGFVHSITLLSMIQYVGGAPDGAAMACESEIESSKTSMIADSIFDECKDRGLIL